MTREKIQRYAACKEGVYTWWCPSVDVAKVEAELAAALKGERELQREICGHRSDRQKHIHGKYGLPIDTPEEIAELYGWDCFD